MKGKFRSKMALVLALSMVVSAIPGVGVFAKAKKATEKVEKAADSKQPIPDGSYRIVTALDESKALDLRANKTVSGTNVQLYDITYDDTWFFDVKYQSSGYYKISVTGTSLCLDHANAEKKDGANCWIYTDNGTNAQRFRIEDSGDGYFYIRSGVDDRCLDVDHLKTDNRTNIIFQTLNKGKNQKWKFVPEEKPVKDGQYRIITALDGSLGLGPAGGSVAEGTRVHLNSVAEGAVPLMDIKYDSKGFYRISAANTTFYFDEGGGGGYDSAPLQFHSDDKSSVYEKWRFVDAGDGYYYIRNGKDARSIDVAGGESGYKSQNGLVYLWSHHGGKNQKWALVEESMPKLENITPFSIVGGIRIRWGSEGDNNNKLYRIDRTFPSGGSSSSSSSHSNLFIPQMSADPAGIEIKYRENEVDAQWVEVDLKPTGGAYVDLTNLTPGAEYIFKIRPYYQTMLFNVPIGPKQYKQDWSKEQKRKTMEGNDGDIRVGDSGHDTIANMAIANGWYAGMHTQLLSGLENNLYAMVCKNRDFQIWIGYQYIKSKICYSWEISDYKLNKYKWVYRGTLNQLKKDLATYGPGSSKVRLSTELLQYKKNKEYTIKLVNSSKKVTWSLPKAKDSRIKYGGVEIVKKNSSSVTIRFTRVKGEYGVYPYIQAKVGDEVFKCYIESGSHPRW